MPGKRYSTEQIAAKLREAERLQGQARASRWVSLHAHRHERTQVGALRPVTDSETRPVRKVTPRRRQVPIVLPIR
jgi:hypothetical protein